jgi:ribosome-binding protein aMBF1 (putative translation factor)
MGRLRLTGSKHAVRHNNRLVRAWARIPRCMGAAAAKQQETGTERPPSRNEPRKKKTRRGTRGGARTRRQINHLPNSVARSGAQKWANPTPSPFRRHVIVSRRTAIKEGKLLAKLLDSGRIRRVVKKYSDKAGRHEVEILQSTEVEGEYRARRRGVRYAEHIPTGKICRLCGWERGGNPLHVEDRGAVLLSARRWVLDPKKVVRSTMAQTIEEEAKAPPISAPIATESYYHPSPIA